jgi:hypothetical protein
MDREDRQMTREEMQKIVDALMPGLKLPAPRTEEEFTKALQPITELKELEIQIRNETVIAMYLMDQLNGKKKFIHELYEIERTFKNELA